MADSTQIRTDTIQLSVRSSELKKGISLNSGNVFEVTIVPDKVICTRMTGLLFETDKTFLLPAAIPNIRASMEVFNEFAGGEILIVGHADAVGKKTYNRDLSIQRAITVEAYLKNNAEAWLNNYKPADVGDAWGIREDQMMLQSLAQNGVPLYQGIIDGADSLETRDAVNAFQNSRGIPPTGSLDDVSRLALIQAYMAEDGTSIPVSTVTMVHGCGEEHPVEKKPDEQAEAKNRRVELFLFEFKIDPQPKFCTIPGGCEEYAQWVKQVTKTIVLDDEPPDSIDDFDVKPRTLSQPRKEEHVVTSENGQRRAKVTFFHLPLITS